MGRAELIKYFEAGAEDSTHTIGYIHDKLGRVKTETMNEGGVTHNTSFAYDKLGRITGVWQGTYNGSNNPVKESDGLDLAYQYNRAGQLTQISYKTSATGEQQRVYQKLCKPSLSDKITTDNGGFISWHRNERKVRYANSLTNAALRT